MLNRTACGVCVWMAAIGTTSWAKPASVNPLLVMSSVVEQFTADSRSLDRTYPVRVSQARMARLEKFDNDELALLAAMNFDSLAESDKIDYLLLKNRVISDLHTLAVQKKHVEEMPEGRTVVSITANGLAIPVTGKNKDAGLVTTGAQRKFEIIAQIR